jgi:hypothetical protein
MDHEVRALTHLGRHHPTAVIVDDLVADAQPQTRAVLSF